MTGHVGSFDSFIHDTVRPHAGQILAAKNIRELLEGSKLAVLEEGEISVEEDVGILRQDRYALRTSAQWIGPQLESLQLARKQIEVELNSTTDNPLIDVDGVKFHHGGNFQAVSRRNVSIAFVLRNDAESAIPSLRSLFFATNPHRCLSLRPWSPLDWCSST